MIRNINIALLENHPDNPRKDVGDVTELAESIKESGILQNLTVVEYKDRFRVIIGHRRLAAAKLAGLSVVPCAVVEMDDKTQVATMLAENMQRADLTVFEQAQGIQMMFNLGSTADEISEKTGFSKKTISHRVKLLELDEEKFKDSLERGATLSDFIKLEKLKDPELKNEVLKHVATNDFDWQLKRALDKQNKDENIAKWMEILNSFAKQVKTQKGYENVGTLTYLGSDPSKFKIPEDASETDYYFYLIEHNPVYFYLMKKKSAEKESEDAVLHRQQVEKEQRRNELREAFERAYELRKDFVYEYTGSKDDIPVLTKCLMEPLRETTYGMVSSTKFADLLKIKL